MATAQETDRIDVERLTALEPYEVSDNPATGEQYRFLERGSDANGEFLRLEIRLQAGARSFPEHVHPRQEETIRVLSGEFRVKVDGDEQSITEDQEVTLPVNVPHTHWNASNEDVNVLVKVRPPLATETVIRSVNALARDGKTNAEGIPNLLRLAVFFDAHPDVVYLTRLPIDIQKKLFAVLAPIGRRLGYAAHYPRPEDRAPA